MRAGLLCGFHVFPPHAAEGEHRQGDVFQQLRAARPAEAAHTGMARCLAHRSEHGEIQFQRGGARELMDAKSAWKLDMEPEFKLKDEALEAKDLQLAEVLVAPRSNLD